MAILNWRTKLKMHCCPNFLIVFIFAYLGRVADVCNILCNMLQKHFPLKMLHEQATFPNSAKTQHVSCNIFLQNVAATCFTKCCTRLQHGLNDNITMPKKFGFIWMIGKSGFHPYDIGIGAIGGWISANFNCNWWSSNKTLLCSLYTFINFKKVNFSSSVSDVFK